MDRLILSWNRYLFGEEKALEMKAELTLSYIERYGPEKAIEIANKKRSTRAKNKAKKENKICNPIQEEE